jgi:uncharacterized membrane protein YczE
LACEGHDVKRNGLVVRLVQLYVGLLAYGTSSALLVRSRLGLDPWDVFHQGLAGQLHLSIGVLSIIVGAVVLLAWWPLRQRPGLGTLSNVVLVGASLDWALQVLPAPQPMWARIAFLFGGILLCAAATGLYITARFGPGPRDGLMTGLPRVTGLSIRTTRTIIEVSVLVVGWLLGGTVGVGTLAFAVLIGPLAQFFLRLFTRVLAPEVPAPIRARRPRRRRAPTRSRGARSEPRTRDWHRRSSAAGQPAKRG